MLYMLLTVSDVLILYLEWNVVVDRCCSVRR